jgi:N-acetylglucosaminyldiphosphoundecaprenol N-acetyl-beta-D-mannosaminyltransferase
MTYKKDQFIGNILKKAQNSNSKDRVLPFVRSSLTKKSKYYILSLNPEILLLALKDKNLSLIMENSDVLLNDGVGLTIAEDFLNKKKVENKYLGFLIYFFQGISSGISILYKDKKVLKGRDLFGEIVKLGNKLGLKIFLLGGRKDEALKTKKMLEASYKKIKIMSDPGPTVNLSGTPISKEDFEKEKEVIEKINSFKPNFVFVAYGAPKQEYWIYKNIKNINTQGVMAVGGTFNYFAGNMKMPSNIFESLGLEWFWRLIVEPKRIIRIFNAVIVFPLKVFLYKLSL